MDIDISFGFAPSRNVWRELQFRESMSARTSRVGQPTDLRSGSSEQLRNVCLPTEDAKKVIARKVMEPRKEQWSGTDVQPEQSTTCRAFKSVHEENRHHREPETQSRRGFQHGEGSG